LKIKYVPYSSFSKNYEDVKRRIPSIGKMKDLLEYEPKINLEKGLRRLINWYKDTYLLKRE